MLKHLPTRLCFVSSPTSGAGKLSRPTHRTQNSFLGRFGRTPNTPNFENQTASPFSDNAAVDDIAKEKQLPKIPLGSPLTPGVSGGEGYFDQRIESDDASPGIALGRRTSLMRKVVNGVKRGAKN